MDLNRYIKVFDKAIDPETVSSIIKWSNTLGFKESGVSEKNIINKEIRDVSEFCITDISNPSKTRVHWRNFLTFLIKNHIVQYEQELCPEIKTSVTGIGEISILKYSKGGHYKFHTDAFVSSPRILSCILMLNNDYEGGILEFSDPELKNIYMAVKPEAGRLIIWPSNFMYPHRVTPITKGIRFSTVAWAY
tara:strand:+ start:567 stop:1139 length:573 start_codon:yes stop_codon:yes gene_type:complete